MACPTLALLPALAPRLALGLGLVTLAMLALWAAQRRTRNAGYVDVGWALSLAGQAALYAWLAPGWAPRSWLLAAMVGVWAGRLSVHLLRRLRGRPEEGRYAALRQEWGPQADRNMLVLHLGQALLSAALALPFLLVSLDPTPGLGWRELAGAALWWIGLGGEALADQQLARFLAEEGGRGRVCQRGLWNVSRHPNYFFEIVLWLGWGVFCSASAGGVWPWLGPLAITASLLFVTGIPPTEAQALRTKGEAYRRYQRTTSPLIPWRKKREP